MHTRLPGTPFGAGTHNMAQATHLPSWPLEKTTPAVCHDAHTWLLSWPLKVPIHTHGLQHPRMVSQMAGLGWMKVLSPEVMPLETQSPTLEAMPLEGQSKPLLAQDPKMPTAAGTELPPRCLAPFSRASRPVAMGCNPPIPPLRRTHGSGPTLLFSASHGA